LAIPAVSVGQSAPADRSQTQNAKLKNKDVLDLVSSGLSADIVTAKIKSSECEFDTSPSALKELKTAGIPDSVISAMLTAAGSSSAVHGDHENMSADSPTTPAAELLASASPPAGFKITYIKSDRKWQTGFRSEPYNKVADYLVTKLVDNLNAKGAKTVAEVEAGCCLVSVELLEVTTHPAVIKEPGIDVSATVTVTDAAGKFIYSKGYRGESRTALDTWRHVMNHACEDISRNIAADENLLAVLATGKL
jgi:hypothetical protein